jgi:hypothetical protein
MATRQLANRRLGNYLHHRQAQGMSESWRTTSPQRQFGCRIPPSGTCTLPELGQGRVQTQFQMMEMVFGKSADASPTSVEQ